MDSAFAQRVTVIGSDRPRAGRFVLYWMQQAQRTRDNLALEWALREACALGLPLAVAFVVTPGFPDANWRHYAFLFDGLADVADGLRARGVPFVLRTGPMADTVVELAAGAALVVGDVGYLRIQREWRRAVGERLRVPLALVEANVLVPADVASAREEIGARTLRPRLQRHLDWAEAPPPPAPQPPAPRRGVLPAGLDREGWPRLLGALPIDRSVGPVPGCRGGERAATAALDDFVRSRLARYDADARDPALDARSRLGAYLHFGHMAPHAIVRAVRAGGAPASAREAFLEQVIVRRELSVNFVLRNPGYDDYETAVPAWARATLERHRTDPRPALYEPGALERAATADPYWNAAQREMVRTGSMHNTMRMYWGKKVIEWTADPRAAFRLLLAMNNRYELDGRDPNGFAGVAWCFGRHDRPWGERAVFGTVRYMNAAGLHRKFRIDEYAARFGPS